MIPPARARLAFCVAAATLLPACTSEPAPVPPLDAATLVLPDFDSVRVTLDDGEGRVEEDGVLVVRVGLTPWSAEGDFDDDGVLEAAVVVWSTGGGSGTFLEVAAFDLVDGAWRWRGSSPLGDRTGVRIFSVTGRTITLGLTEHGPDDPLCCPTVEVDRVFEFTGDGIRPVGSDGTP